MIDTKDAPKATIELNTYELDWLRIAMWAQYGVYRGDHKIMEKAVNSSHIFSDVVGTEFINGLRDKLQAAQKSLPEVDTPWNED